jgi:hypothetical protein
MSSMPSGWFPNPSDPSEEVYWNGTQWTGTSRSIQSDTSAPADQPEEPSPDLQSIAEGTVADGPTAIRGENGNAVAPATRHRNRRSRLIWVGAIVLVILLGAGVTTAVLVQNAHNEAVATAKHEAAVKKAAVLADAAAAKQAEEDAAKAAQEASDDAERADRAATVITVEASITKMAKENVAKGLHDGPVLKVSCNPVNGGSTDDLTDQTTAFDCFVANEDNGDGTQSGFFYNANINWTTGEYTYGFGKSS